MSLWAWKAPLYSFVRALPLLRRLLRAEQIRLARLLAKIPSPPQLHLDIGSGTGDCLPLFHAHPKILCCDASWAMLCRLQHPLKMVARAQALPLAAHTCDFVSAIGVLEYVREEQVFFTEARRVLAPHGHFLFTSAPRVWANYLRGVWGERLYLRSAAQIRRALAAAGWVVVAHEKSLLQEQWLVRQFGNEA